MRVGRAFAAGRWQAPFLQGSPTGLWRLNKLNETTWPRSQTVETLKLANQLNYGNQNYSYNGEPAPKFYGYTEGAGIGKYGWNGYEWSFSTVGNQSEYTPVNWIVPANQPTQQVRYVNNHHETQPKGTSQNLQKYWESVPMPTLSQVPAGKLTSGGTDKEATVYRPSTGEVWEFFALEQIGGEWVAQYGGYIGPGATGAGATSLISHPGLFPYGEEGAWGAHAEGTTLFGGLITTQDIIEVLRGGKINHMLSLSLPATIGPATKPCSRYDTINAPPKFYQDGITLNPAYGASFGVDAIKEGGIYVYPAGSSPSEFGMTHPIEIAIFEAIREYGLMIVDSSGVCSFQVEWPGVLGSPYSWAKVNPYAGSFFNPSYVPASWADPSLPVITEQFYSGTGEHGYTSGVFRKQPWKDLLQVNPFTGPPFP